MAKVQFFLNAFSELTNADLYQLLQLRSAVFVVEQDCVYQDLDGLDMHPDSWHLLGQQDTQINSYCRLLPPGSNYPTASIGRMVVRRSARQAGLARVTMQQAIDHCHKLWPDSAITISAQNYLLAFYQSLGFCVQGESYLEDGIPHTKMILTV